MNKKKEFITLRDEILNEIIEEYEKTSGSVQFSLILKNVLNMLINLDKRIEEQRELTYNLKKQINLLAKQVIKDKKELLEKIKKFR